MPKQNGNGPQIKRREAWIDLPPEYDGFQVKVWLNAPSRLWSELSGGEEAKTMAALQQIVLEHNGWLDYDGQQYPPANSEAFWQDIPTELAACILVAAQAEMQKLPNSIAPRNRRSARG